MGAGLGDRGSTLKRGRESAAIRWALRHFANEVPGGGLGIALYSSAPEEVWHPAAIEFVRVLETQWPARVAFKDPLGRARGIRTRDDAIQWLRTEIYRQRAIWLPCKMKVRSFLVLAVSLVVLQGAHAQGQDASCHNPFVDGVRHATPKLNIDLDIAMEDWSALAQLMDDFASSRGWPFRDSSQEEAGAYKALQLSICTERGVRIFTADIRWAMRDYANEVPGGGLGVAVFSTAPEGVWQAAAAEFVSVLESHWPGRVGFEDLDGRPMNPPAFLPK